MAGEDTVLCVLTAILLLVALLGLPAGTFHQIPLVGRCFPSPPFLPFAPRTPELDYLRQAAESLTAMLVLLQGVNGLEAQHNLLREVRNNVQGLVAALEGIQQGFAKEVRDNVLVLVAGLDGMKQDLTKEVRDNVLVLVAGLDDIKQLTERLFKLLERGVLDPEDGIFLRGSTSNELTLLRSAGD